MGLVSGLVGRDTTGIDPKLLAIMKMRREKSDIDNTPIINMAEELKAAAANKNLSSDTQKRTDSLSKTFDHKGYLEHLDQLGYQVVPKTNPPK